MADICHDGYWSGENAAFYEKMQYGTPLGKAPDGALYNQVVDGRDYYYQQLWSDETNNPAAAERASPDRDEDRPHKGLGRRKQQSEDHRAELPEPDRHSCRFGKVPAKSFTVTSPTSLTAVSPPATSAGPSE